MEKVITTKVLRNLKSINYKYLLGVSIEEGYLSMSTLTEIQIGLTQNILRHYEDGEPDFCADAIIDSKFILDLMDKFNDAFGV